MPPVLVVVTGAPGSGKTSVAVPLARALGYPLVAKDELKEALWEYVGPGDRERFLAYGRASYPLMLLVARLILVAGGSAVIEGNFVPERAADELSELRRGTRFELVQVLCVADAETCLARYRERSSSDGRHPMHRLGGEETEASLERRLREGVYERPIPLEGRLFTLDTRRPVDVEALAREIAQSTTAG